MRGVIDNRIDAYAVREAAPAMEAAEWGGDGNKPENIPLVYLRRIDEKVDRVAADIQDLKGRVTSVEERLAGVELPIAGTNRRIDRVEERLDRIEKRLDLTEAPR